MYSLDSEFWKHFTEAAVKNGWSVHGNTSRRLVADGIFVHLKNGIVSIKELPGRHSPYATYLISKLKPVIDELLPEDDSLQKFIDALVKVYGYYTTDGEIYIDRWFLTNN